MTISEPDWPCGAERGEKLFNHSYHHGFCTTALLGKERNVTKNFFAERKNFFGADPARPDRLKGGVFFPYPGWPCGARVQLSELAVVRLVALRRPSAKRGEKLCRHSFHTGVCTTALLGKERNVTKNFFAERKNFFGAEPRPRERSKAGIVFPYPSYKAGR